MGKAIIEQDKCKGCGLCTTACPKGIVKMATDSLNKKGFRPAQVVDADKCIGCGFCAIICPDIVITVEK